MSNTTNISITKDSVRVRIAPSPTGIPHIGNTRTALFNYLFAKHNDGKFILRIEDTDRARYVPESEKAIIEILEWLGIFWDEKYIQSERIDIYKKHADDLVEQGFAYKDEGAIRFKIPKEKEIVWTDGIGQKEIKFNTNVVEDFVILKSDGFPTYHLANVIDDHLMKISHVIRGDEWISSTPKHFLLYEAFGWKAPIFAHLPVILGPDKTKLSKRHGAKSALDYRNEGYLKEALLNFMVLLGWNPGGDKEILSFEEMIKLFDLKDVNTASPIFDIKKLEWTNGVYIRKSQISDLKPQILELTPNLENKNQELIDNLILLAQSRMVTLCDFYGLAKPFLEDVDIQLNEKEKSIANILLENLSKVKEWKEEEIFPEMKKVLVQEKIKMSVMYKIITGKETGLPLPKTLEIFGKENTIKRLNSEL